MSLVDLRVELPAYSHSFTIRVAQSSTIRDVKQEIARACSGAPRPDGMRLVWRGRLLNEDEVVENIWKSPDDSRIIHLAVHPSSWTGTPPNSAAATPDANGSSRTPHIHAHHLAAQPPLRRSPASYYISPFTHIIVEHNIALSVLSTGIVPPAAASTPESQSWKVVASETLRSHGWAWPAILDEPYPPAGGHSEGVKYERVALGNVPYLSLTTTNATPSPLQQHALKVLSYTFPILFTFQPDQAYSPSNPPLSLYETPIPVNHHLQQIGMQPLHLAPGQHVHGHNANDPRNRLRAVAAADVRAIRVRALIIPLIMLVFRTVLLMYFFSPSKRPVFGVLLALWMLYEAWGAIRVVLGDGRAIGGLQPGQANAAGQPPNAPAGQPAAQPGQMPAGLRAGQTRSQLHIQMFLDSFSQLNLDAEDAALEARGPAPAPSWTHKLKTFVALLVLTIYPAVWDCRRATLRRREGRVRTEANVREAPQSQETDAAPEDANRVQARAEMVARHERRPEWVREYVQLVQRTEWPEEA